MGHEVWTEGDAYEMYMGRWSRRVAEAFLNWLYVPPARSAFCVGDAQSLPVPDRCFDAVVSGLALNFVPGPRRAVAEFARVAAPGGTVAAYVWDYAEGMALMRYFWEAATAVDPAAAEADQGRRFPLCRPGPLRELWMDAGLYDVAVQAIEVATVFADFDDYWSPFLGGQGSVPGYAASLTEEHRDALRELLRRRPALRPGRVYPAGREGLGGTRHGDGMMKTRECRSRHVASSDAVLEVPPPIDCRWRASGCPGAGHPGRAP